MSVLENVRRFEERLVERLRELEPVLREYDQLCAVAEQLGVSYTPREQTSVAAAPRRRARSAGNNRSGRGGARVRTGTAAAKRSSKPTKPSSAAKRTAARRPTKSSTAAKPAAAAAKPTKPSTATRSAPKTGRLSRRPVLNTPTRAQRGTATPGPRPAKSTTPRARHPPSRPSGSPSRGDPAVRTARAGERDDEVVHVVAAHPGITVRELAEQLAVAPAGLYRVVGRLTHAGRLRKDGRRLLVPTPAAASDIPPSPRPTGLPDSPAIGPTGGPQPAGTAAPTNPDGALGGSVPGVYVYGVVARDAELTALDQERLPDVSVMELGHLAALVLDIPAADDSATSEAATAHWQVLAAAAHDTPVVPLRAGIAFPSDDALADQLLWPLRAELTNLLEHFPRLLDHPLPTNTDHSAELRAILASPADIQRLRDAIHATRNHQAKTSA